MHIRIFLYSTFSLLFFIVMISCSSINLQDSHPLPKNLTFSEKISFAFHPDKIIFDDYSNAFILLNKSENTIYKTNLSGKLIQKIGESGFGDGQFINITDISCDSFGNIYALDNDINKIIKFDENGQFVNSISFAEIDEPELLEVKNNGDLLIYDSATNLIYSFSSEVNLRFTFGKFEIVSPKKISSTINLNYILDTTKNEIIIFDNFGGFVKSISPKNMILDISPAKFFLLTLDNRNNLNIIKGEQTLNMPLPSFSSKFSKLHFSQILLFKNKIGLIDQQEFYIFQYSHQ